MARTLDIQFPAAGVVRRWGLRSASRQRGPFPAVWALNARLEDNVTERLRGGSFDGINAGARPDEIVYRDRVLTFSGRVITATRMGDHTDTEMSADASDMRRPAVFQFSEAGEKAPDVVALVPHKDQYLLGFSASETWVQTGDPFIGPRRRVSDEVGIVGADAWCVAHDTVYFLSSHGLYSVGADGSNLTALSEEAIPDDLTGVDDDSCTLTYQHSDRGVYIHKTGTNWYFDAARQAFWPFDKTEADSHVLIGPLKLGDLDSLGLIQTMHGVIAQSSAKVYWHIVPGDTAEQAAVNGKAALDAAVAGTSYADYVRASGDWTAGRSHTVRPRVTAMWAVLWLYSAGDWGYEGITCSIVPAGLWRK